MQANTCAEPEEQGAKIRSPQRPCPLGRPAGLVGGEVRAATLLDPRRCTEHDGWRHELLKFQSGACARYGLGGFGHMHPRYGRRLPLNPQQSLLLSLGSWGVATVTVLLATLLHALN